MAKENNAASQAIENASYGFVNPKVAMIANATVKQFVAQQAEVKIEIKPDPKIQEMGNSLAEDMKKHDLQEMAKAAMPNILDDEEFQKEPENATDPAFAWHQTHPEEDAPAFQLKKEFLDEDGRLKGNITVGYKFNVQRGDEGIDTDQEGTISFTKYF